MRARSGNKRTQRAALVKEPLLREIVEKIEAYEGTMQTLHAKSGYHVAQLRYSLTHDRARSVGIIQCRDILKALGYSLVIVKDEEE